MVRSIVWFRQDLRLHDNEALIDALRNSDELLPVYVFDPRQFRFHTQYGIPKISEARARFLIESITQLRQHLRQFGSELIVRIGKPEEVLYELAVQHKAYFIYCNRERTKEEVDVQDHLEKRLWAVGREMRYSRGKMLYYTSDLPFPVTHCPDSFAIFKKETEHLIPVRHPLEMPGQFPPLPGDIDCGQLPDAAALLRDEQMGMDYKFPGGEMAGFHALKTIEDPSPGKLFDPDGSRISPWVSMGCLSPKKVYYAADHMPELGKEIQQQLLHRDHLRLMGKKYGDRIFYRSGIKGIYLKSDVNKKLLTAWQKGETGVDIIDAAMHQLNKTGWIAESLRRLVAGYFIKVLHLDWRKGAAYFEYRLIDYDPCTNWVSWMNVAGLGPDNREDRVINYEAMGKRLDPEGAYLSAWL